MVVSVVIPRSGRKAVLAELHEGHPGVARMKSLARMYVWWPQISQAIEVVVRSCPECQCLLGLICLKQ